MAGNVMEWVSGWYDAGYYAFSPTTNPTGPDSGVIGVLRGGWDCPIMLRVSHRLLLNAEFRGGYIYGFRCCRSAGP